MKKCLALMLAVLMTMSMLVGCSSGKEATTAPQTSVNENSSNGWSKTITLSNGKTYPSGTVSIIAPFAAGGGVDLGIRLFAKYAQKYTDATIIVENITGGSGLVGIQTGLSRPSDGCTIWHIDSGPQYVTTSNYTCPFDVLNDMVLIGQMVADDRVWLIRPDEKRFTTAEELFAYAKEHPNQVTVATSGAGTIPSLATYYVQDAAGVKFSVIAYNGASEAKAAFLGGHCDIMAAGVSEAYQMLQENQCVVLFTLTDERIYDNVPTAKELGYNLISLSTDRGLAMSAKTDPAIVEYWQKIMEMVCTDPDFIEEAKQMALNVRYRRSQEFTEWCKTSFDVWHEIKESLGI